MPHPRQFTLMHEGSSLANASKKGSWEAIATGGPATIAYRNTQQLDLRGLLAGDETGILFSNIVLQEAGPLRIKGEGGTGNLMCVDMLTTQRPTDEFLSTVWEQPSLPGVFPGFLVPTESLVADEGASKQDFNPSMVTWGLWRFLAIDKNILVSTSDIASKVIHSGYFGEGEMAVAPHLYWTRLLVPNQLDQTIMTPSANLVCRGQAVDLTVPQEITAMMRAVQR